jgi:hypothetical protein
VKPPNLDFFDVIGRKKLDQSSLSNAVHESLQQGITEERSQKDTTMAHNNESMIFKNAVQVDFNAFDFFHPPRFFVCC